MAVSDICYGQLVEIDDLDRQIAQCLAVDGRVSFSRIAEILGASDQTVARRYRRLRAEGVIRVVGLRGKQAMVSLGWMLHMRCVPGSGPPIAETLSRRPDTAWVQLFLPRADLAVAVGPAFGAGRDRCGIRRVPRGRVGGGRHRRGQPRGVRGLPRRGSVLRVPDLAGGVTARGRPGGDVPDHPHAEAVVADARNPAPARTPDGGPIGLTPRPRPEVRPACGPRRPACPPAANHPTAEAVQAAGAVGVAEATGADETAGRQARPLAIR